MAKKKQKNNKAKRQSHTEVKMDNRFLEWKAQLIEQIEKEAYNDAIQTLATMIQAKSFDADCLYQGAYAYFMLGDYQRATQWVENTLQYDGQNVAARLLLARICILEDRPDEALAIFEFMLKNFSAKLDDNQREDVRDILDFYGTGEPEKILQNYPVIADFLGLEASKEVAAQEETVTAESVDLSKEEMSNEAITAAKNVLKAEAELQQIRGKEVSIAEKIKMLHTFAAGYFYQMDYAAAKIFLAEALQLDAKDDRTLYNLAILYADMGEKEKAVQFATTMSYVDFALLKTIR
ncbi:MAG: CDC27 family protein [Selenomonas sp.]|uniref:tetratricopeptide repeat protein n=1 Tax=Selenomonas sp. TaxID=2053611 RepID=UPI0025F39BE2|nr:CDC27 family protein [Selenomonas sp.]MCR5439579.1 CDC27 family protein [Selenomonas sp.]